VPAQASGQRCAARWSVQTTLAPAPTSARHNAAPMP